MRPAAVVAVFAVIAFGSGCLRDEMTSVPDVTGSTLEAALAELEGKPLTPEMVGTCDEVRIFDQRDPPDHVDAAECTVIDQVPEPGTTIANFGPVRMTVR